MRVGIGAGNGAEKHQAAGVLRQDIGDRARARDGGVGVTVIDLGLHAVAGHTDLSLGHVGGQKGVRERIVARGDARQAEPADGHNLVLTCVIVEQRAGRRTADRHGAQIDIEQTRQGGRAGDVHSSRAVVRLVDRCNAGHPQGERRDIRRQTHGVERIVVLG